MNRKEEPLSKIMWRDVYEALDMGDAVRQHQMRVRETAREILDYWQKYEFFNSYRMDNKSNGGILITPNHGFQG